MCNSSSMHIWLAGGGGEISYLLGKVGVVLLLLSMEPGVLQQEHLQAVGYFVMQLCVDCKLARQ